MSRFLTERSIDHVVIERGEVANTWKHERWDSMRLLTPNRQTRLYGYRYDGDDPDGYMSMPEVIAFIEAYSEFVSAPVKAGVTVTSVQRIDDGYRVTTDQGDWTCRAVVLASGAFNLPNVPAISKSVPASITMMTPKEYRNPDQLEDGGVLVVGAAATGIQLADEIQRSGRPVTMAVGEHVRLPRVYRGHDILWWMEVTGVLDEGYDEVDDIVRARSVPSPQLVGSPGGVTMDLNALTDIGVKLIGGFAAINDGKGQFSGSLRNKCALADLKMHRLLDTIDEWATENGLDGEVEDPQRFTPTRVEDSPPLDIDFNNGEIRSIVWATGFRPDYSWLNVPVLDRKGRIRHDGGVVDSPGMYLLGSTFMRRRKSSFIHGAEDDARDLCAHLASYLHHGAAAVNNPL
jgi:putative flavoprotein involved in K+ transport